MPHPRRPAARTACLATAACLLLAAAVARGEPAAAVEATIRHLIGHVADSGLTFIRNGNRHTAADAAAHIERKYRHFRDEIGTAEEFIDRCATQSLVSGRPYLVIDRDGETQRTADWLRAELAAWRARDR